MKRVFIMLTILALAVICAPVMYQCSDDDPLAPFQPEITNATDNFQLQATGVDNQTASLPYDWSNTGTQASVNHSTTTINGTARLIIKDAGDVTVYDNLLVPSLNDTTLTGSSGTWEIRLALKEYSGTLNFRVQKY
jgi:hypothetical protein